MVITTSVVRCAWSPRDWWHGAMRRLINAAADAAHDAPHIVADVEDGTIFIPPGENGDTFGILRIGHREEHVSQARAWIERRIAKTITFPLFIADEAVNDIIICAGETIANAVVHAADDAPPGSTITVTLIYSLEWIRVEVTDAGTGGRALQARDVDPLSDENGRGLTMVGILSDTWGERLHDHGRTVWFTVGY